MGMKPELGVALTKCYFCGENDTIVMNTRLTKHMAEKVEELNGKVIHMNPCNKCQGYMKQGIILLTFDPHQSDPNWNEDPMPNPYRTGGFFVVTEEFLSRILQPEMFEWAKKHRFMFIEHEAAGKLGLFEAEGVCNG